MITVLTATTLIFGSVIRVGSFGAVPNDGLDDFAAITSAIQAAARQPGSTVLLDGGTYTCSSTLLIPSGVAIAGAGRSKTTIKITPNAGRDPIGIQNADPEKGNDNITLRDFTLDSSAKERPESKAMGIRLIGIGSTTCDRIKFQRIGVVNSPFAGIQLMGCRNVEVRNCVVHAAGRDGITVWDHSANVQILNNTVTQVGDDCIGLNSQRASDRNSRITNVTVRGNTLEQSESSVYGTGIRVAGVNRGIIERNEVLYAQGWGIVVEGGEVNGGGDGTPRLVPTLESRAPGEYSLDLKGPRDGGPYVFLVNGQETEPVRPSDTDSSLEHALRALAPNARAQGNPGGPYVLSGLGTSKLEAMPYATSKDIQILSNRILRSGSENSGGGGINVRVGSQGTVVKGNSVEGYYSCGIVGGTKCQILENTVRAGLAAHPTSAVLVRGDDVEVQGNLLTDILADGVEIRGMRANVAKNKIGLGQSATNRCGIRAFAGSSSEVDSNSITGKGANYAIFLENGAKASHKIGKNSFQGFANERTVAISKRAN